MVKGMTNALVEMSKEKTVSECDEIYVVNESGAEVLVKDKVLVDMGRERGVLNSGFSLVSTSSYYDWGGVFLDDDNAFYFFRNAMARFSFVDGSFEKTDCAKFNVSNSSRFKAHKNGIVSMDYINGGSSSSSTTGSILFWGENRLLPNDYKYIGKYNGKHYAQRTYYNTVWSYDIDSNAVIENVGSTVKGSSAYYLDEKTGKGFTSGANPSSIYFWYIDEDGKLINEATVSLGAISTDRIVGASGADVGDYIIVASNVLAKYETNSAIDAEVKSNIRFYKIFDNDGVRGVKVADNVLNRFLTEDCLVFFDNRNDVLEVGSRNGVYAYKFNRQKDEFEEISLGIKLDSLEDEGYCYRLALSQGLDKAMVGKRISKTEVEVLLYDLGMGEAKIVENSALKYQSKSCFTAIVLENDEESGLVKVKLVLPEKIDVMFESNVDVLDNEIVFKGVE